MSDATGRSAADPWMLPETPSAFIWRHPSPAPGLTVSLTDENGAAWPFRAETRDDGLWRDVVLEPLTSLRPGQTYQILAELPDSSGTTLWREKIAVENGATEPPPWKARRGGRRRR